MTPDFVLEQVVKITIALLCGAAIGFERTQRMKDAGIRTHCIIAIASSLLMIISKYGFSDLETVTGFSFGTDGADPSRIAAQVITGICFVGAGVIFRDQGSVKGLSTAAGIWATAAVGLAIGGGLYLIGIVATILIVGIQIIFHKFSIGYDAYSENEITIKFRQSEIVMDQLIAAE